MIYFGLDPATTSGWSLLKDDKLLERGTIQLMAQMDLPQKLHYFHIELRSLLSRLKPDWVFLEDVFLGISGVRTLAYLARINGVAIATAFEVLQERVKLYEPNYWKANSFEGLKGSAKKWKIQLSVIKHYNIPVTGNFEAINKTLSERDEELNSIKDEISNHRQCLVSSKSLLARKRNPLVGDGKNKVQDDIKVYCARLNQNKKSLKEKELEYDKIFKKISVDIASQTGITENIADSIAIAYCGYKETK